MIDIERAETAFALRMVRDAVRLARRVQRDLAVEGLTKSDMSPVTVADYGVQALVGRGIQEVFPDHTLVGEEHSTQLRAPEGVKTLEVVTRYVGEAVGGATESEVCAWIDRAAEAPSGRFWTLDPIDGTKGYLRGGQYAVALALIENGRVILGVLGCPSLDERCRPEAGAGVLLVARRGEGTWGAALEGGADRFDRLQVSPCGDTRRARLLRSFESGHTNAGEIDDIARVVGVEASPVLMDSQAKYAVLASGGGEMLFRLLSPKQPDYREKIWDQAAGSIILEEAGGRITDLRGKPLDFTQGRTLAANVGVFASNGRLHDAGLEAIARVCGRN